MMVSDGHKKSVKVDDVVMGDNRLVVNWKEQSGVGDSLVTNKPCNTGDQQILSNIGGFLLLPILK